MSANRYKAKKAKELFQFYRGMILDACEQEAGENTKWNYLRSRLLKLLSPERGLECKIIELILEAEDDNSLA